MLLFLENRMAYGPLTKGHIGSISRGEVFSEAGSWRPDAYTIPFPARLEEFIESYFDLLPTEPSARKAALTALIQNGAHTHGVKIARSTLNEWLSGGRDPSVSSSDSQTRENIYRLCAALDLDLELTEELFEKVFFTRAFDLKVLKEFAFFFFARNDSLAGVEGCHWYKMGEKAWEAVSNSDDPSGSAAEQPIRDTVLLADRTAVMNEVEFLRFLSSNRETFFQENRYVRLRKCIREYAFRACRMTPELSAAVSEEEIPYEPLVNTILGYSQRSVSGAAGTVSSLKSLPAQLTTNFPTGQILRKICIGDVCSYDQAYKMFCLLLFYSYHVNPPPMQETEQRFGGFLRFANLSLEQEGCTELYPRQPYGGLLLFCAAQKDPLSALRAFVESSVRAESESVLMDHMKSVPSLSPDTRLALIRCADRDPFLVDLIAGTLCRRSCRIKPSDLINAEYYDDRASEIIQRLYSGAGFSSTEKRMLGCCALLPSDGASDALFCRLFSEQEMAAARMLGNCCWMTVAKGVYSMHHRVRRVVLEQEVSDRGTREFLDAAAGISIDGLPVGDVKVLKKLARKTQ